MAKLSSTKQKKAKDKIDDAKAEIVKLLALHHQGVLTWEEYCLKRLPFIEVIGTRQMYDERGNLK